MLDFELLRIWLYTSLSSLSLQFMRELSSSWLWTVTARKGMFATPSDKIHPLDIKPHIVITEVSLSRVFDRVIIMCFSA